MGFSGFGNGNFIFFDGNKHYQIVEHCYMVHLKTIDTTWGKEIDKEKSHKLSLLCKQGSPMAHYE
jgi:hypothetical protein